MRTALTVIAIWLLVSLLNFGALNGEFRAAFPRYGIGCSRESAAVNALFSLMPIAGTACAIFGIGIFAPGFTWKIGCDGGGK